MDANPKIQITARRRLWPRAMRVSSIGLIATSAVLASGGLLSGISQADQTSALRTALGQSAASAIGKLGILDGFLANKDVRIPLPGKLQKAERTLAMLGLKPKADELVTAMNRAAEAAVPEAKTLLADSVRNMSIADAAQILTGDRDAATQYFRRTTSEQLTAKFLPIVQKHTSKLQVAQRYNAVGGKLQQLGVVDAKDANLDNYVTQKALDGLFHMIAKEEAAIRSNPLGQSSKLLQRVFGTLIPK
jgi:hypothetical protein